MRAINFINSRKNNIYVSIQMKTLAREKSEYAKKRVKIINGGYKGSTSEFKSAVLQYWSKYGKTPKRYWYTLYCNGASKYDPRYIPDSIWYLDILPHFNDIIMRRAYTDKNLYDSILKGVKLPETIIKNINGYYFDENNSIISQDKAVQICLNEKQLIAKPAVNSGRGRGILFFDKGENDTASIYTIFSTLKKNFALQRVVRQHPDLARINPESLNTIRVVSFHFKGEVHILSTILRMGGIGSRIDNISAGGISCVIKPDGWLVDKAVTRKSEWSDHHASGIKFKDIRVPNYEGIIETAKRLHLQLPYFNIIGWDFAIGEDGAPIMIEFNVMPEQNQISCGPTFGDMTKEVLDEVFRDRLK